MKLRTILLTTSLCITAQAPAWAVNWSAAPLACLPDRAERWSNQSEMTPCHCPPPEFCPEKVEMTPKTVSFHVDVENGGGYELTGEQVLPPGFDPANALKLTPEEVKEYIADAMMRVYNVDTRVGCGPEGCYWSTTVTTKVGGGALDGWAADQLKLPIQLAVRCCDNVCPDGSAPMYRDVQVNEPRPDGTGLTITEAQASALKSELSNLRADIVADAEAAAAAACADGGGGGGGGGDGGGGAT